MALSARALCTVALVETELGLSSGADDARIERLIESASRFIGNACGRPEGFHHEAARVDKVTGKGGPLLYVPKTPLLSVDSIIYDPDDGNETIDSTEYHIVGDGSTGEIYREAGWVWDVAHASAVVSTPLYGTEQQLYQVTYACGYVTRPQGGSMTLPEEIEDACIQLVSGRYRWQVRDPSVTSERLLSWNASYKGNTGGWDLDSIAHLIEPYRHVEFA